MRVNEYWLSRTVTPGESSEVTVEGADGVSVEELSETGLPVQSATSDGPTVWLVQSPTVGDRLYLSFKVRGEVILPVGWTIAARRPITER